MRVRSLRTAFGRPTDRPTTDRATEPATDRLTAELGPHAIGLVPRRVATPGVTALVADHVYHLGGAVGPAEAGPLPGEAEAGPLRATRLLAPPVAHVHLALLLVGAAELRLLALGGRGRRVSYGAYDNTCKRKAHAQTQQEFVGVVGATEGVRGGLPSTIV